MTIAVQIKISLAIFDVKCSIAYDMHALSTSWPTRITFSSSPSFSKNFVNGLTC